jgi:aminoglycoside 6'-N-acetyltransferase I
LAKMRAFKSTDLDRCVRLFVKVFSQEPWEDQWPSLARAKAYLSDIVNTPGFRGFVLYEGRTILGLCFGHEVRWWAGDEFYIDEFCIDSDVQRRGLGTELMNHVKQDLLGDGIQFAVLLTERETLAERFYAKQGFTPSAKTTFMYQRLSG